MGKGKLTIKTFGSFRIRDCHLSNLLCKVSELPSLCHYNQIKSEKLGVSEDYLQDTLDNRRLYTVMRAFKPKVFFAVLERINDLQILQRNASGQPHLEPFSLRMHQSP